MKKNYLFLAAAATMFTACVQSDLVSEIPQETPQAIEFETFANKATRATENSDESYIENDLNNHHTNFIVWGYKNISDKKVFNGVTVSYNNGWNYATESVDKVYWDKTATRYDFYAAAPATTSFWTLNNNNTEDNTDDYITTAQFVVAPHNAASYQATTDATKSFEKKGVTDLMIAAENYLEKGVGDVPANPVDLNFIHILSRLNVTVKASINNVTVKNITVGNIKSTGSFDENDLATGVTLAEGTHTRWTLVTAETEGVTATPFVAYTTKTEKSLNKDESVIAIEALVIPQSAGTERVSLDATDFTSYNEPYLYISYDINGENYTQAFNLADVFKGTATTATAVAFNEGWQNTLNIIINPGTIEFEANVAAWDDNKTKTETIQ